MIARQSASEERTRERELEEFDRALQQDIRIRIIGTVFIVLFIIVMTALLPAPAKAASPSLLVTYVPEKGVDLFPVEVLKEERVEYQELLTELSARRLYAANPGDFQYFPGKCFAGIRKKKFVVDCIANVPGEKALQTGERVFSTAKDALTFVERFTIAYRNLMRGKTNSWT